MKSKAENERLTRIPKLKMLWNTTLPPFLSEMCEKHISKQNIKAKLKRVLVPFAEWDIYAGTFAYLGQCIVVEGDL